MGVWSLWSRADTVKRRCAARRHFAAAGDMLICGFAGGHSCGAAFLLPGTEPLELRAGDAAGFVISDLKRRKRKRD